MAYQLVLTTCPDTKTAETLAASLVELRLAACVSMIPKIRSVYEWKGRVTSDEEHLLLIKTHSDKYSELERAIRQRHPYELPEIIAVPIEQGSADYLAWVAGCLSAS